MSNSDPLVEIPVQPIPDVPETALENINPANLGRDLQDYELLYKQADLRRKEYELTVEKLMLGERKLYAGRLFVLSLVWLLAIAVFLFLAGWGKLKVADSVLIALITTTTANVLGLFYIVARWLFPNKNSSDTPVKATKLSKAKQTQPKKARAKNDQFT
jgi:hypothetical protein